MPAPTLRPDGRSEGMMMERMRARAQRQHEDSRGRTAGAHRLASEVTSGSLQHVLAEHREEQAQQDGLPPSQAQPQQTQHIRTLLGIQHWLKPLQESLQSAAVEYDKRPHRRVVHESLCTGAGSEYVGITALNLDMELQAGADVHPASKRFVQHTWPLTHL